MNVFSQHASVLIQGNRTMRIGLRLRQVRFLTVRGQGRRGAVLVVAAILIIILLAFVAFSVDIGFIVVTKSQLQSAADSAALSASLEMRDGIGVGATKTSSQVETATRAEAVRIAGEHRNGDSATTYANATRDIRLGRRTWNPTLGQWVDSWGTSPYNLLEVTLHRQRSDNKSLPLFFAPLIGTSDAEVSAKSVTVLEPGVGFRVVPGSCGNAKVLPIAIDLGTWNNLLLGGGSDNLAYNPSTNIVSAGSDGLHECNLFPTGSSTLPSGNRGTVDIGNPASTTADLKRQIVNGLNADDLSYYTDNELRTDSGPVFLTGDTGLSAGIQSELASIVGQVRAIPVFCEVSGPEYYATYTIVKFVGVRVLAVRLHGSPTQKYLLVQPGLFLDCTVIRGGNIASADDSIFSPARLTK